MLNNDKLKSKETEIVILKGIMNALNGVSSNLTTEGEEEGSSASVLERIAVALETIAERLNPLYTADYVEPDPDPDNNGEGGEGGKDPDPSDNTEPGVS